MRASEVRSTSGSSRGGASSRSQGAGTAQAEPAPSRRTATSSRGSGTVRGRQAEELPAVTPGTEPDEVERSIIREIHLMPPGRMGYATIKTIEETLRSKAGVMGATRKEIPSRLQRLEAMGLFKRSTRPRGAGEVETGELVSDHPTVTAVTSGLEKPVAKEPRPPRAPRRERGSRLVPGDAEQPAAASEATAEQAKAPTTEAPDGDQQQHEDAAVEAVAPATSANASPVAEAGTEEAPAEPFRWVRAKPTAVAAINETEQAVPAEEKTPAVKPARKTPVRKPAGTTRRKATTTRSSTRTKKEQATPEGTPTTDNAVTAEPAPEPPPG